MFVALEEPYNPESVSSFKHKSRPPGRHVSVEIKAFMPMSLAITSPDKFLLEMGLGHQNNLA